MERKLRRDEKLREKQLQSVSFRFMLLLWVLEENPLFHFVLFPINC